MTDAPENSWLKMERETKEAKRKHSEEEETSNAMAKLLLEYVRHVNDFSAKHPSFRVVPRETIDESIKLLKQHRDSKLIKGDIS